MFANKALLKTLAEKYVSPDELVDLNFYLEYGELHLASAQILGAIDRKWVNKEIEDDEAREAVGLLDFGPKDMAHLKMKSACLRKLF